MTWLLSTYHLSTVNETSRYNLRNSNDIRTVNTRTSQYYNSFLPATIREWNALPEEQRNFLIVASFKSHLNQSSTSIPKYYYVGNRHHQILHTRLRTKCSSLNYDIYLKNLTDSPLCRCGKIENSEHYLLQCRFHHWNATIPISNLLRVLRCPFVWWQLTFSWSKQQKFLDSAIVYKRFQKILTESMYLILAHFLCTHVPVSGTNYCSSLIATERQTCCYLTYYFLFNLWNNF